jgi:LacI family transcriptional regulator
MQMRTLRHPSISDVAKHVGVSAMTVSRVLSGSAAVSVETRQRVETALLQLGFKKDRIASSNARRRGQTAPVFSVVVDAIVEDAADRDAFDFYARVVLATVRKLELAGCQFALSDLTRDPEARIQAVAEADAIIFCSPVGQEVAARVARLNPSIVMVSAFQETSGASQIGPDDAAGGRMAAELAGRGGHRHVAILTTSHSSYGVRAEAFCSRLHALQPASCVDVIDYPLLHDGIHSEEAAILGKISAYWNEGRRPSLFFAVGGFGTLMLYRFLRSQGVEMPNQTALIGFDSLPFYDHLDLPITRIGFDVGGIGTSAAEEALRRLASGDGPRRILLPCSFVEGRSFLDVAAMDPKRSPSHAP